MTILLPDVESLLRGGGEPVPVSATEAGDVASLLTMEIEPVRAPVAVGVNPTVIVPVEPGGTVSGSVMAMSPR